jgi:hypothetical protein
MGVDFVAVERVAVAPPPDAEPASVEGAIVVAVPVLKIVAPDVVKKAVDATLEHVMHGWTVKLALMDAPVRAVGGPIC